MIEQRIADLLAAAPGIVAYVEDRITPVIMRQDTKFPCMVYGQASDLPDRSMAGSAHWKTKTIDVVCYAHNYFEIKHMAEEIRKAVDTYSETSSEGSIRSINVSGGRDDFIAELEVYFVPVYLDVDYDDDPPVL